MKYIFNYDFDSANYTYKSITKNLSGKSGAIIFNIINKDGSINNKYIGNMQKHKYAFFLHNELWEKSMQTPNISFFIMT